MLAGRVAVVTGSAGGIGRAIAHRLSKAGAKVAVCDFDRIEGVKVAKSLNEKGAFAAYIHTDVTRDHSVKSACAEAFARFGRIDILVNNAASFVFGHLGIEGLGSGTGTDKNVSSEDWNKILQTNIVGYARMIENVVPYMRKNQPTDNVYNVDEGSGNTEINAGSRGAIVNVASVSGFIAQPEFVPYNVSKAGIIVMTKCTAMDLAGWKIRVNCVSPGTVETKGSYNHMNLIGLDLEEGKRMFAQATLLERQAAPEEIANGVAFLASDESSYMTGANLVIDGGQTI